MGERGVRRAEMRKPFDVIAKGLSVSSGRGDETWIELFLEAVWEAGGGLWGMMGETGRS